MSTSSRVGVYLLANDRVLEWVAACAESLRHFNPGLRVVVMPFDRNVEAVSRLCGAYGFELWEAPAFEVLDQLQIPSRHPALPGQLHRKLAAFWGPLERFLVLDVDTVVLSDLSPLLQAVARHPADTFWFAHCDEFGGNLDEVYSPGPWRDRFIEAHGSHAGNGGIWAGAADLLSLEQIVQLAHEVRSLAQEFVYPGQGFLNYCLDRLAIPVRNLHSLGIPAIIWAGVDAYEVAAGAISDRDGAPVGIVHWAGYELTPQMPYRSLWEYWASASRVAQASKCGAPGRAEGTIP